MCCGGYLPCFQQSNYGLDFTSKIRYAAGWIFLEIYLWSRLWVNLFMIFLASITTESI